MNVGCAVLVRRGVLIMFVGRVMPEGRAVYIMIFSRAVLVSGGRAVLVCRAAPTMIVGHVVPDGCAVYIAHVGRVVHHRGWHMRAEVIRA